MIKHKRASIAIALFLIFLGGWFLAIEISPVVKNFAYSRETWPFNILIAGGLLFLLALITWTPNLMLHASTVSGIGGMLYWQNANNAFETWSYSWALIPGFVGIGFLLAGIMHGFRRRGEILIGSSLIMISLILFGIFGSFLGGKHILLQYWPVILVLLGLIFLLQSLAANRHRQLNS